ncbi:Serine/threonine protein kinase, partial [Globisporangium splendens]
MKYVIDGNDAQLSSEYSVEHMNLIRKTFDSVIRSSKSKVNKISDWYLPRDQVQYDEEQFDEGPNGTLRKGKWKGSDVIVKCVYLETPDYERAFLREANLWWKLNHPHILKPFGACHLSTPMFFVSEYCENGNFVTYFQESENRRYLWTRFLEAAHGLDYLHSEKVVHGDLKCNNILVGNGGKTKMCGFRSFFSEVTHFLPLKTLPPHLRSQWNRWKALECHEGLDENDLNLQFKSDVYSFGLCIIEAVSGEIPWGMVSDDEILDNLYDGNAHPRTPGFTDKQWEFVQAITRVDYEERESLDYAIKMLTELAEEEKQLSQEKLRWCRECEYESAYFGKSCCNCGAKFDDDDTLESISDGIGGALFRQTGKSCTHCGELNNTASRVCCECGARLQQMSESAPSRKKCSRCGDLNRIDNRFCCQCGVDIEVIRRNRL